MATTMASTTTSSCSNSNSNSGGKSSNKPKNDQQKTTTVLTDHDNDGIPIASSNLSKYDVVIVGAGVAGVSAAYHLHQLSSSSSSSSGTSSSSSTRRTLFNWLLVDSANNAGTGTEPRYSGSATMPTAGCVKMMVQLFAGSCEEFIHHHGRTGAKRYLKATQRGLEIQKQIAKDVLLPIIIQQQQTQNQEDKNPSSSTTDAAAAAAAESGEEANDNDNNNNNKNRSREKRKNTFINELGSYYVAYENDEAILKREFEILRSLLQENDEVQSVVEDEDVDGTTKNGAKPTSNNKNNNNTTTTIEWCDKERLSKVKGMSDKFHCGIYFPNDAIIDSSSYSKTLSAYLLLHNKFFTKDGESSRGQFWPNTTVIDVKERHSKLLRVNNNDNNNDDNEDHYYAMVTMALGSIEQKQQKTIQILAKHVVMATGGLYKDPNLHGLIKPCYSYLVHVPVQRVDEDNNNISNDSNNKDNNKGEEKQEEDGKKGGDVDTIIDCSPNFFTWGYTHDWCFVNGKIRCSGEDHFSAYKDSKNKERCYNLSKWTMEQYGCNTNDKDQTFWDNIPQQYGIYTETPDMVPLIGHFKITTDDSNNKSNKTTNGTTVATNTGRICYLLGCNAWGQSILSYCASLIPGLLNYKDLSKEQKDILRLVSIQRFSNYQPSSTPTKMIIPSPQAAAAAVRHHQTMPPPTHQHNKNAPPPPTPPSTSTATNMGPPQQPASHMPPTHPKHNKNAGPPAPSNGAAAAAAAAPISQPPLPPGPPQVPPPMPPYGMPTAAYVVPVTYAMPYGMPPPIYQSPYTAMPMAYPIPPPLPPPTTSSAAAATRAAPAPPTTTAVRAPTTATRAPAPARTKKRAKQVCSKCWNPACRRPFAHQGCTTE